MSSMYSGHVAKELQKDEYRMNPSRQALYSSRLHESLSLTFYLSGSRDFSRWRGFDAIHNFA
jgi:hypothetical protein